MVVGVSEASLLGWCVIGAEVPVVAGKIEGQIVAVDDDGNLITDILSEQLSGAPTDERVVITCDEHETMGIHFPDHDQPEMTLIAILAESGSLQLSIVGDSARIMLGIGIGEKVLVKWS